MRVLLIVNGNPYDGTDVAGNALQPAEQLLNAGLAVTMQGKP
jgi:hypothetical protein